MKRLHEQLLIIASQGVAQLGEEHELNMAAPLDDPAEMRTYKLEKAYHNQPYCKRALLLCTLHIYWPRIMSVLFPMVQSTSLTENGVSIYLPLPQMHRYLVLRRTRNLLLQVPVLDVSVSSTHQPRGL